MAAATAPWWGNGLLLAGGAVGGALIAFVSTRASDSRKFARDDQAAAERLQREERQRWDHMLRDAASNFIAACNATVDDLGLYEQLRGEPDYHRLSRLRSRMIWSLRHPVRFLEVLFDLPPAVRAWSRARTSWTQVQCAHASLILIAPEDVIAAAEDMRCRAIAATQQVRGSDAARAASDRYTEAQRTLVTAVRSKLVTGAPSFALPKPMPAEVIKTQ